MTSKNRFAFMTIGLMLSSLYLNAVRAEEGHSLEGHGVNAEASTTMEAPIEAEVSPKVDLKGYVTLEQIPASLRGKVLAGVASQVVIEPNPAAFEGQELDNGGLFFQNGMINGRLDLAWTPFCSMKFNKKLDADGRPQGYYYAERELIQKTASSQIVPREVLSKFDGVSSNWTTLMPMDESSKTVKTTQCMVGTKKANGEAGPYREPSVNELIKIFGSSAKVYVKLKSGVAVPAAAKAVAARAPAPKKAAPAKPAPKKATRK